MMSAIGAFLKKAVVDAAKKTLIKAAAGDKSSQKKVLIVSLIAIAPFFISIIVIITVIFGPIMLGAEYIKQMTESSGVLFDKIGNVLTLNGWCSTLDGSCTETAEQKYYQELNEVYQSYKDRNVTIDQQLITATIFYSYAREPEFNITDEDGYNQGFIDSYCEAHSVFWVGEKLTCPISVKEDYENIYNKYFNRYKSIATNYEALKKQYCLTNNFTKQLELLSGFPITSELLDSAKEELCEYFLWESPDIEQGKIDTTYILYKEGKDDIKKLAKEMVSGNRINLNNYKNYLINTYIPKHFSSLLDPNDKEKSTKRIAEEIMMFATVKDQSSNYAGGYGSCLYNIGGKEVNSSEFDVVLLSCDGKTELERIDFEKYIKGVVYGEIGASWNAEVLKSQAVAARSYTLTRNQTFCPGRPNNCEYGYNPSKNEIRMRNCEGDQVYCDYEQGCQKYNYNGYNSIISGLQNPSLQIYKHALTAEQKKTFEDTLNSVQGVVLLNDDSSIFASSYIDVDQNAWNSASISNPSLDYNEILIKHYWNKNGANLTASNNCTSYGVIGEFSTWKQFDPRWKDIPVGSSTMHRVGCLVTSISIQLARSGMINLPEFDPGIFANELSKRGSFSDVGGLLWGPLKRTLSELSDNHFVAVELGTPLYGSKEQKISILEKYIDLGYLLVVGVKNDGHFVAIDRIENGEAYIFDPGDSYITTISQYGWGGVSSMHIYKVVP